MPRTLPSGASPMKTSASSASILMPSDGHVPADK
nr:MAG TPA: hypothetical protein [Caudoviricetes sp.]